MSTHTKHEKTDCFYFCTLTCFKWLPLFDKVDLYDNIINWFEIAANNGLKISAYVIMPNHLHFVGYLEKEASPLNKIISNAKRFWAYEIVKQLKIRNDTVTLNTLAQGVQEKERLIGKKHQVFRLSFVARECFNQAMLEQKIDYIHHNPVTGKWSRKHLRLCDEFWQYEYSSANYYLNEVKSVKHLYDYRKYL